MNEIIKTNTELETRVETVINSMKSVNVTNDQELEIAIGFLVKNKQTQKIVKEFFEPERKEKHEAYKAVTTKIKKFTDMLTESEKIVKKKTSSYEALQEKIRQDKERKIREKQERIEREQREAQAKKEALEAERIEKLEKGEDLDPEKIEELEKIDQAPIEAIPIMDEKKKINGASYRTVWKWELVEKDKVPKKYFILDEKAINAVVKSMGGKINIPGIRIYSENTTVIRT